MIEYDPPTDETDARVCGSCRRAWSPLSLSAVPGRFRVLNSRTGKYHSTNDYGQTDCGRDATGEGWLWPL